MQQSRNTSHPQGYLPLPAYTDSSPSLVSEAADDSFDSTSSGHGAAVPLNDSPICERKRHSGRAWLLASSVSTILALMLLVSLHFLLAAMCSIIGELTALPNRSSTSTVSPQSGKLSR